MSKRKGFTLIELMVVITIIGILAALLFPAIKEVMFQAHVRACANNLKELYGLQMSYMVRNKGHLPGETGGEFWLKLAKISPPLLADEQLEILSCPVSGTGAAPGKVQYRGPVDDANLGGTGPVGADLIAAHGQGR